MEVIAKRARIKGMRPVVNPGRARIAAFLAPQDSGLHPCDRHEQMSCAGMTNKALLFMCPSVCCGSHC